MLPFSNYNVQMYFFFYKNSRRTWYIVAEHGPVLKQMKPVRILTICFIRIRFNIILTIGLLPSALPANFCVHFHCLSHSAFSDFRSNVWWRAHITNLFVQLFPSSSYWSPLGPDNILNALF
jgi:hypothetical protein